MNALYLHLNKVLSEVWDIKKQTCNNKSTTKQEFVAKQCLPHYLKFTKDSLSKASYENVLQQQKLKVQIQNASSNVLGIILGTLIAWGMWVWRSKWLKGRKKNYEKEYENKISPSTIMKTLGKFCYKLRRRAELDPT